RKKPRSAVFVSRGAVCDLFATGKDGRTLPEYWAKRSVGKHPRLKSPDPKVAQALAQLVDFADLTSKVWLYAVQMVGYMLDHPTPTSAVFARDVAVVARIRDNSGYFDAVPEASRQASRAKCVFADCALVLAQRDETLAVRVVTRTVVNSVCGLSVTNDGQVVFARDGVSSWSELVGELRLRLNAEQSGIEVDGLAAVADVRDNE
ncbi:hypothetical protein BCR44DRAFT_46507, partial [Catenaria anguillulae PL171]